MESFLQKIGRSQYPTSKQYVQMDFHDSTEVREATGNSRGNL